MHIKKGQKAIDFTLEDAHGRPVSLHDFQGKKILLSFYRDAGCPFCNLRIYELTRHYNYFAQRGLIMLAVFHSDKKTILRYVGKRHQRPFPMLADPAKRAYELYGVDSSVGKLLLGFFKMPRIISAFSKGYLPTLGAFDPLMPADFLINPDFSVAYPYYSRDASAHIPLRVIQKFLEASQPSRAMGMAQTAAATG